jgi:hypothetical protein
MDRLPSSKSAVLPLTPAASTGQHILDPKSATYHDDLHKSGFISSAQLKAIKSGNRAYVKEANKEVFNLASFVSQRPLTKNQSEVISPAFGSQQTERDKRLVKKYEKKGYQFVQNSGKNNNCLIISLLQHITGNYKSNHDVRAADYRIELDKKLKNSLNAKQQKAFKENKMLPPDHITWLLGEMAKDKTLKYKNMTIELWMANAEGEPVSFSIGEGKAKAIIFQRVNHFEAVIPPVLVSTTAGKSESKTVTPVSEQPATFKKTNTVPTIKKN